jgi:hypothetical protein
MIPESLSNEPKARLLGQELAKLLPEGYREVGRTDLIKPTSDSRNRRELGAVNWSHPAYANRHIFARNDDEIISVSLAKER